MKYGSKLFKTQLHIFGKVLHVRLQINKSFQNSFKTSSYILFFFPARYQSLWSTITKSIISRQFQHILLIVMSFLTLRQQIDNWTLQEDDQFFNTVKALSDAIFESEKQITENISQTKYSLHQSQVNLGFGFNQFLKVSEVKFTENKIQEKTFQQPEKPPEQFKPQTKSRLQLLKEALSIGLKNLEIKQDQGEKDNMSVVTVSEYSFSMSTAVFKNTRLPPLFGTKQFISKPYLNLYTEEDANEINQYRRSMTASQIVAPDDIGRLDHPDLFLPPPPLESVLKPAEDAAIIPQEMPIPQGMPNLPRLSQVLGTSSKLSNQTRIVPTNIPPQPQIDFFGVPPPPPIINLPPPPPLTQSFIDIRSNNQQPKINLSASFTERPVYQSEQLNQPPKSNIKKALSFQEELALRLQKGKNYKEFQTIHEEQHEQPSKIEEPQKRRPTNSQNTILNLLPPSVPPQAEPQRQDPPLRESVNFKEIVNLTANRFGASQGGVGVIDDDEQEEQSSIFKKTKTKKKEEKPQTAVSAQQIKKKNQENEQFMKKTTFVDGNLFKKKNTMVDVIIPKKNEPQKKNLFDQESDEQDKVTLSKPVKKAVENNESPKVEIKPQPPIIQNKPANPLGGSKISTSSLDIKPIIPKIQPKQETPPSVEVIVEQKKIAPPPLTAKPKPAVPAAKTKGGLFEDDQEDDFLKKKKQQKPKEAPKKTPAANNKKNLLLGDDSDDDFLKKKPLPKLPQNQSPKNQQKQSPIKIEPKKEEVVIKPEPVVVVEQKPRPSEKSIIQVQPVEVKRTQQVLSRQPQPSISKTSQVGDLARRSPQKKKISNKMKMFDDDEDDDILVKKAPKKVQPKQEPRKLQKTQPQVIIGNLSRFTQQNESAVESPVKKDPKRIPGLIMGMGMGPLIPAGMVLTKPSDVKVQQKIALEKLQEQKILQEQNRLKEIQNQKRRAQYQKQQQTIRLQNQRRQQQERERQQQDQIYRLQQQSERQRRQDEQRQRQRVERQQHDIKLAQQRDYEQRQKAEKRRRQQEQRDRLQREQEQEQRRLAEQQRRQQQQQLRQQRQRIRIQEEQRLRRQKREAQQRARYEQQQREQYQRRQREEYERQYRVQKQRQYIEQRQRKQKQQQQRRQRQEYERQLRQKWEYQQNKKMILQQERLQRQRQELLKIKQQNQRVEKQRREKQERQRQEKLAVQKKNQLVPKLPQKGPSLLPQLPTQTSQQAKKQKKGLFDEDDEKPLVPEKKNQKKPLPAKTGGKGGLFDDDGEQDLTFKPKAKAPVQKKEKKKNLFDDQDDVPIPSKTQPKKQEKVVPKQVPKDQPKKKNLFDDEDEGFTAPIKKQPSNPAPPPQTIAQPPKKTGLFGDDDSPVIAKKPKEELKTAQIPVKVEPPKKKGLFDDDEGDYKKTQPKPPAPKIVEKPVVAEKSNKRNNIFDDDEQEIKPAKKIESPPKKQEVSASENTKKTKLFDDQEDESFKPKKQTSVKQPVRQVTPVSQPPIKNNPIKQEKAQLKSPLPTKPEAPKKKGLFDDDEVDTKFTAKAPPSKPAPPKVQQPSPTKKKNIFDDQAQDASFMPKKPAPKAEEKPAAKKNLFDGDQQDFSIKKAPLKPSANNKKKLFDDSD